MARVGDLDEELVAVALGTEVTAVNDAPVLDNAGSPVLGNVAEDAGAPSGAVGTLVSSLVPGSTITDVDAGALQGIAITAVNAANGALWYSLNGGTNWSAVGTVSNTSALLLAADANTRLYFAPALNYNGTVGDALTFRAWDRTTGSAGSKVSTATNGGTSAFSAATETVAVTVTPVNDAPTSTNDSLTAEEDLFKVLAVSDFGSYSDIEGTPLAAVQLELLDEQMVPANIIDRSQYRRDVEERMQREIDDVIASRPYDDTDSNNITDGAEMNRPVAAIGARRV